MTTKKKGLPLAPDQLYSNVVDGCKYLYKNKMKPLEDLYKYENFHSAMLTDSDIDAKPMVLLLGQYSTGKTTFIRHLVERDFPGQNIGPEPTTDRFNAVMWGSEDRVIPGNTAAVQDDKPFQGLSKFGTGFLGKFQCSTCAAPLLEKVTFIDTPGVLSGEKQRIGRSYDFPQVCEWFAERADMILLLFDAHKLDISDEFRNAIESLKGHDDKIRVVLNKADKVSSQQLLRVYGALMWSLGRVIKNPEVVRVYLGSFWDQPLQNDDTRKLLEAEMSDLVQDLVGLPRNSAVRRVNDLVKRARVAKVHVHIIGHLRAQMPLLLGKEAKQAELIENLATEFKKVHRNHQLPAGDFPDLEKFKENLRLCDVSKFPKLDPKLVKQLDEVLTVDFPKLMSQFPLEIRPQQSQVELNPFADEDPNWWALHENVDQVNANTVFQSLNPENGKVTGAQIKSVFMQSQLPMDTLSKIWRLSDLDKDGKMDLLEFSLACHLIMIYKDRGVNLPEVLPPTLIPPQKRNL